MKDKKQSSEQKEWLRSPAAQVLRNTYAERAKVQANAVISAAMTCSDPHVRGLALSFATWKEAIKEIEVIDDSDD